MLPVRFTGGGPMDGQTTESSSPVRSLTIYQKGDGCSSIGSYVWTRVDGETHVYEWHPGVAASCRD